MGIIEKSEELGPTGHLIVVEKYGGTCSNQCSDPDRLSPYCSAQVLFPISGFTHLQSQEVDTV